MLLTLRNYVNLKYNNPLGGAFLKIRKYNYNFYKNNCDKIISSNFEK